MADIDGLNQLIWTMGLKFRAALAQQSRLAHDQALTLAATHLFSSLPEAVRRTLKRTTPEQIVQRGKRLGSSVSPLAIWLFGYYFLLGREVLIDFGRVSPRDHVDDMAVVLDFWRRLAFTHRGDGRLGSARKLVAGLIL